MSFWSQAQEKWNGAVSSSKRAAQRTKLKGEIELLSRSLKRVKQEFGVEVYDYLDLGNDEGVKTVFAKYKAKVEEINQKIEMKRQDLAMLRSESSAGESVAPEAVQGQSNAGGDIPMGQRVTPGVEQESAPPRPPPTDRTSSKDQSGNGGGGALYV